MSDPKVVITVEDDAKNAYSAIRSEVCQRTINPVWNHEAALICPTNKVWLRFNALDHVRILSDKPLGSAYFDLSELQIGETREVWLPLVDSKVVERNINAITTYSHKPELEPSSTPETSLPTSEWGHLRAIINVIPHPGLPQCSLTTLKRLRVAIEKQVYRPGDLVRGVVFYNVSTPVRLSHLDVYGFGKTAVHWSESAAKTSIQYRGAMDHFKESKVLLSAPQGSQSLEICASSLCAAFEFRLPDHLPASNGGHYFQASTANTGYRIGATAFYANSSAEDAFSIFTVLPHHEDAQTVSAVTTFEPNTPPPITTAFERSCDAQGIKYKLWSPRAVYASNSFSITVHVENTTSTPIQRLCFKLVEMMCVHANRAGTWFQKRSLRTITGVALSHVKETFDNIHVSAELPIQPGQSRTFTVALNIPETVFNTALESECPLLSIQHAIVCTNAFVLDAAHAADYAAFSVLVSGSSRSGDYPLNPNRPSAQFLESSKSVALDPFPPQVPIEHYFSGGRLASTNRLSDHQPQPVNIRSFVFENNAPESFPFLAVAPITGQEPAQYALSVPHIPSESQ